MLPSNGIGAGLQPNLVTFPLPSWLFDGDHNPAGLVGPDGNAVLYGKMTSGAWMKVPSNLSKLRLTGTGAVRIDSRDSLGAIHLNVASYTVAAATDQIEYPCYGENAVNIRATLTGTATAEVI